FWHSLNKIMANTYYISNKTLTFQELDHIINNNQPLALSEEAVANINKCREYLDNKMQTETNPIYGINNGVGSVYSVKISSEDLTTLQENLMKSHACGTGDEVPAAIVKIMLLLQIQSLRYAHSGGQLAAVHRLSDLCNHNILPILYTQGSLGGWGD